MAPAARCWTPGGPGGAAALLLHRRGPAFLRLGRQRFGADRPHLDFARYNVEGAPEDQGFEPGSMEVVLASNVLHATLRISAALRHCHSLLKPGGILVVNEMTSRLDYNTLTFGLAEGWWRHAEDEPRVRRPRCWTWRAGGRPARGRLRRRAGARCPGSTTPSRCRPCSWRRPPEGGLVPLRFRPRPRTPRPGPRPPGRATRGTRAVGTPVPGARDPAGARTGTGTR